MVHPIICSTLARNPANHLLQLTPRAGRFAVDVSNLRTWKSLKRTERGS
jgi:hypothetical protein